jgi:hypothetical protein
MKLNQGGGMKQRGRLQWLFFLGLFCTLMLAAGVALAATVSGTVTNNTATTGSRVYLRLVSQYGGDTGLGVSIPTPGANASASYAIRGVPDGNYEVKAFLDGRGNGTPSKTSATRHSNDPFGSAQVSVQGGDASVNIMLNAVSPPPPLSPPHLEVIAGSNGALINWNTPKDSNGYELAYGYNIYWHTDSSVSSTNYTGMASAPANNDGMFIQGELRPGVDLTNGTQLWYAIYATRGNGAILSASSNVFGPVTIGPAPSDGVSRFSVSGSVSIDSGITPTGPLYIAVVSESDGLYVTRIASPSSSNTVTVTGVPNGTYRLFAILDQDNNGVIGAGDYKVGDKSAPGFSVSGADVTGLTANVPHEEVAASVTTSHSIDASGLEQYGLAFGVEQASQLPVNAAIAAGPGVAGPVDLAVGTDGGKSGLSYWVGGVARPMIGTGYTIDLGYASGGSATKIVSVSDVLDSFPQPTAPVGAVPFTSQPTFTWTAPLLPPAGFSYRLQVGGNNLWWGTDSLSAGQTSAVFNFDNRASQSSLADTTTYTWQIAVQDRNGNQASMAAFFFSGGSISGRVTDATTGTGIPGIFVQLYDGNGGMIPNNFGVSTDANGKYTVGGLAGGTYRVCFWSGQNTPAGYGSVCYGTSSSDPTRAANVSVSDPQQTQMVNVALVKGATVTGTVTDGSGVGIAGVSVQLSTTNNSPTNTPTATTDDKGNYTLSGIQPGSYTLYFNGSRQGYIAQWYQGKSDLSSADTFTLGAGESFPAVTAVLAKGGGISGTVTDKNSGQPIAGVAVQLYGSNGFPTGFFGITTDAAGSYAINGVPDGTYKVCFSAGSTSYVGGCYNGKLSNGYDADPVTVQAPATTTGIDAALTAGGTITGKVSNGTGGIGNVQVELRDASGNPVPGTPAGWTDQNGNYRIAGVPAGTYWVFFDGANAGYVGKWYDGSNGTVSRAGAVSLTTESGQLQGVDALLFPGGSISGVVTDAATSAVLSGIMAQIYDENGNPVPNIWGRMTDQNGKYSFGGLTDGSYKVCFFSNQNAGQPRYLAQCYNTQSDNPANATAIAVSGGGSQTGINAALSLGAVISGRAGDSRGQAVAGGTVNVVDGDNKIVASAMTDPNGNYSINNLRAGSYRIQIQYQSPLGLQTAWYGGADPSSATPVTAGAGAAVIVNPTVPCYYNLLITRSTTTGATGTVSDGTGQISCGPNCSGAYAEGAIVTLTATPGPGSVFLSWAGVCSGNGACQVTMDQTRGVWAYFGPAQAAQPSSITVPPNSSTGAYSVIWEPSATTGAMYLLEESGDPGFSTVLHSYVVAGTAFPVSGKANGTYYYRVKATYSQYLDSAWTTGSNGCTVTLPVAEYALNLTKTGTGSGSVTENRAVLTCGSQCSNNYPDGTVVSLTAAADSNSYFAGWSGACSGTGSCTVTMESTKWVTAVFNKTAPIAVTTTSLPAATLGTAYGRTLTATGGVKPYSWAVTAGSLPAGLTLNAGTGSITGTPTALGTGLSFTVQVTDSQGIAATKTLAMDVVIGPVSVTSSSTLPAATLGTYYGRTLTATGGVKPYSWAVTDGTLPAGLTLNAGTGSITGTPTALGTGLSFTVQVTDSQGIAATKTLALDVVIGPLSVATATPLQAATLGTYYGRTLTATGGVKPYSWAVTDGSLPTGLTLNAGTGSITGTPTAPGTGLSFTVQVADSRGITATKTFAMDVVIGPLSVTSATTLPAAMAATSYGRTLTAAGGVKPYSWAVTGGTLPAGLTLNAGTGVITGVPSALGTGLSFTVQVTDSQGIAATKTLAMDVVIGPLSVATATPLQAATLGTYYGRTLTATGGLKPYGWAVTDGSLPAGLTLNAGTGSITGTPTAPGTGLSFTVQVTDSRGITATKTFAMDVVIGPLSVTSATTLPAATGGTSYGRTLTAAGGVKPYSWAVTDGTLPAGLTLNAGTGVITGIPSAIGTGLSFTVQVTDSQGIAATKTLAMDVVIGPLSVTTASPLPAATLGTSYGRTLTATGGVKLYSWAVTAGSLPAGLALNPATGVISGKPTVRGTFSFTVQVTDAQRTSATKEVTLTVQ